MVLLCGAEGEASEALAVTGGFAPLATALIAIPLLEKPLGDTSVAAFALMVLGGFVMFASEKFNSTGFVSGYVFFTLGTFLGAMALLIPPQWRKQIFERSQDAPPKSRLWYFVNRFISGVGSFLIFLAISKTSPATVSAIAGVRYAIIFAAAYLLTRLKPQWLREDFRGGVLIGKSAATALIVAGLVLAALGGSGTGT